MKKKASSVSGFETQEVPHRRKVVIGRQMPQSIENLEKTQENGMEDSR